VTKNVRKRQGDWNLATQKRLSMTNAMLSSIKNIKMLGIQEAINARVLDLRGQELKMARRVRLMNVIYNASGEIKARCSLHQSCGRRLIRGFAR
jgi:ATP-binding cassette subfamily C (CFTR/MRP) protein 1